MNELDLRGWTNFLLHTVGTILLCLATDWKLGLGIGLLVLFHKQI